MNSGTTGISPLMFVAEASFSEREREGQRRRERERACQDRCIAFIGAKLLKKTPKNRPFYPVARWLPGNIRAS